MRSFWIIGYCWRTSAAASRPRSKSCFGVYLFLGGFTTVWANTPADADTTTMSAAARVNDISAMTRLSRLPGGVARILARPQRAAQAPWSVIAPFVVLSLGMPCTALAQRELHWHHLAVDARLEADG